MFDHETYGKTVRVGGLVHCHLSKPTYINEFINNSISTKEHLRSDVHINMHTFVQPSTNYITIIILTDETIVHVHIAA